MNDITENGLRTDDVLELIYRKSTDGFWTTIEEAKKNVGTMIGSYRNHHAAIMESFFTISKP